MYREQNNSCWYSSLSQKGSWAKALEEDQQGITKEKSALEDFAEKYTIDGESGVMSIQYFQGKTRQIKDFLRSHRNIKVRLILVCLMERKQNSKRKTIITQDKVYFHPGTYINLEATDVKQILSKMIKKIYNKITTYIRNGSGWYFKKVLSLEIHTVNYKPMSRIFLHSTSRFYTQKESNNQHSKPRPNMLSLVCT